MADVIIIGGGLIGMMTARELHQAGAEVLLLERGQLGGESSWAGGGILSPLYPWRYPDAVNVLARKSQQMYEQIAQQLLEESSIDPEYQHSGLLILVQDDTDQARHWAQQWQMDLHCLHSVNDVQHCEPALHDAFEAALWLPDICQMRNPRLVKALRGSLDRRHIQYREQTEVTNLRIKDQRITGVQTASGEYAADKVLIAGGAWSARILSEAGRQPDIAPVKGQMIIFKGEAGVVQRIVLNRSRYLIPRRDGRILAGSTLEFTQFEKQTSREAKQELIAAAVEMVPALKNYSVEHHWAGLRPGSPQGVPYICEHPEIHSLYINAGHYRNGVILGAASCRLMADIMVGRSPEIDPQAYAFGAVH